MILIYEEKLYNQHLSSVNSFSDIYENAFPDNNEREDFGLIVERIKTKTFYDDPKTFLVLVENGGMICEYYYSSNSLIVTYIAVDQVNRNNGVGRKLITEGLEEIKKLLLETIQRNVSGVFFEVNNPNETGKDSMDKWGRLKFFSSIGAKFIDINYVQPSLGEGKNRVRNLWLCAIPVDEGVDFLRCEAIIGFLESFYAELGVMYPRVDYDFKIMEEEIKKSSIQGAYLLREIPTQEKETIKIANCSFAFHIPLSLRNDFDYTCPFFGSFERDLFAGRFQNKSNRPYQSHCLSPYSPYRTKIFFPEHVVYVSEGRIEKIYLDQEKRELEVDIYPSLTVVNTREDSEVNESIFSMVIQPVNEFSELDLVKLSALFGSNQESTGFRKTVSFDDLGTDFFHFVAHLLEEYKLIDKNDTSFLDISSSESVCFSVQICGLNSSEDHLSRLIKLIAGIQDGDQESIDFIEEIYSNSSYLEFRYFCNFLCGLTLGIFDFERMGFEEFMDTINPIFSTSNGFFLLNRSGLLSFSNEDSVYDSSKNTIGISPYLIVPNIVLTYNESLLSRSHDSLTNLIQSNVSVRKLENVLSDTENRLIYEIPNIFNYETERTIIEKADFLRKLTDYRAEISKLKGDINARIERKYSTKRSRMELVITLILLIISFIQIEPFIKTIARKVLEFGSISEVNLPLAESGIYLFVVISLGIWFLYFSNKYFK